MQQLNQKYPDNYLLAMRILWAPIGLMIIFWIFVPESPWFHARRGDKEKALKAMKQLYGGVKGYDLEEEYGIIARTIEHEREVLQDAPRYVDVFKGLNLVSAFRWLKKAIVIPEECQSSNQSPETHPYCDAARRLPADRRSRYHQHLLNL